MAFIWNFSSQLCSWTYEKLTSSPGNVFYFDQTGRPQGPNLEEYFPPGAYLVTCADAERNRASLEGLLFGNEAAILEDGVFYGPRFGSVKFLNSEQCITINRLFWTTSSIPFLQLIRLVQLIPFVQLIRFLSNLDYSNRDRGLRPRWFHPLFLFDRCSGIRSTWRCKQGWNFLLHSWLFHVILRLKTWIVRRNY